jgi:hypothetical protein
MKKLFTAFLASILLLCQCTPVLAAEEISIDVDYYFVDSDGNKTDGSAYSTIYDGWHVPEVAYIQNNGADCYVKVRLVSNDWDDYIQYTYDDTLWVEKEDGNLYYTQMLPSGQSVNIFNGIAFGDGLMAESAKRGTSDLKISIEVDALIPDVEPDFTKEDPWFWYESGGNELLQGNLISLPKNKTTKTTHITKEVFATGASPSIVYVLIAVCTLVLLAFLIAKQKKLFVRHTV